MLKEIRRGRGKPSNVNRKILEYLARIAVMHDIDSSKFFKRIVESWNQEKSECKPLIVRCRKKTEDSAIFLFTAGRKVVAQFSIPTEILQRNSLQLERYMTLIS